MLDGYAKYRRHLAMRAAESGDWEQAFGLFAELFHADPWDAEAAWLAGVSLTKLDRADEATVYLRKAFQLAPDRQDILGQLAAVTEYAGDADAAMSLYYAMLELSGRTNKFALRECLRMLMKKLHALRFGPVPALAFPLMYRVLALVEREDVDPAVRIDVGYFIAMQMEEPSLRDPSWKPAIRRELLAAGGERVPEGLYRGMRLSPSFLADCGVLEILGPANRHYSELIEDAVAGGCDGALLVGAGRGWDAVGLALLVPGLQVVAWESDAARCAVCREMATVNGVADRVRVVAEEADAEALIAEAARFSRPLCLINIGGGELEMLDDAVAARLAHADFIVECHEKLGIDVGGALSEQFSATHDVALWVRRRADAWKIDALRGLDPALRWLAVYDMASGALVLAYDKRWLHARRREGAGPLLLSPP